MVRDEDFDRATGRGGHEGGAKSGAPCAQNEAQQRAATGSKEACDSPKSAKGPGFLPVPATVVDLSRDATNGPGGTRTRMGFTPADFKSAAYTNSATGPTGCIVASLLGIRAPDNQFQILHCPVHRS